MYRGKYKICWTHDNPTRNKFGRLVTLKEERFEYLNYIDETAAEVRRLLKNGCYDIWIEEVKDDGRDHENY